MARAPTTILGQMQVSLVDKKTTPPRIILLQFSFDTLSYNCYKCQNLILSINQIEDYVSSGKAALGLMPDWEGCKKCNLDLVFEYAGERWEFGVRDPAKIWPWVALNGIWFEAENNNCPICYNKLGNSNCKCGILILPESYVNEELGLTDKMSRYRKAWNVEPRKDRNGKFIAKASLIWDNIAQVYKFTFDWVGADFVEVLKKTIPSSDRAWDIKTKTWFLSEHGYDICKLLIEAVFQTTIIQDRKAIEDKWKEFSFQVQSIDPNKELETFTSILTKVGITWDKSCKDGKLAVKAYRKAAMFLHPDRNPSGAEDMSKLNSAWANLDEYFGLKKNLEG